MAGAIINSLRLMRAGLVLAEHGVRFVPNGQKVPLPLRLARGAALVVASLTWPFRAGRRRPKHQSPIAAAFADLGPSYIKAGQFLAARPDLVGQALASDFQSLQDRMTPFSRAEAESAVAEALGKPVAEMFASFGPPIAAASIAQVHKAMAVDAGGHERAVAVKVLRPDIEARFARDLESFYFAARLIERMHEPSRRLKPVAVIDMLARSVTLEMDLRLEAAAISEMAENTKDDRGFRVPAIDWTRTGKRVLTLEWIDATPIGDVEALNEAGHDLAGLGEEVIRHFLRHAMRDGFFHADMHQGNLFVEADGTIVAVDFGIMGRLSPKERRFLAEILFGFISRDYRRAALAHFAAGYVPAHHSVEVFAQALRAIGEPLMGRPAEEISMGHLLGQLFAYTEVFDMETRPELILLQKTMVVVEGVARTLDARLNIWTAAEPIVRDWLERELGLEGRLREAGAGAQTLGSFMGDLPMVLLNAGRAADAFAGMVREGLRLDEEAVARVATAGHRARRSERIALWIGALALAALAAGILL